MKKIPLFLLTLLACVICNVPATAVDADDLPTEKPSEMYRDLAEYWAPTIYQDVNETYLTRADIPTAFNYDGDWNGGNNWENLENITLSNMISTTLAMMALSTLKSMKMTWKVVFQLLEKTIQNLVISI